MLQSKFYKFIEHSQYRKNLKEDSYTIIFHGNNYKNLILPRTLQRITLNHI